MKKWTMNPYSGARVVDHTGETFGKLTVLEVSPESTFKRIRWICQCECGAIVHIRADSLTSGSTVSCGCYRSYVVHNKPYTDGRSFERLYHVYKSMKSRCHNKKSTNYRYYGARGIRVCDEWFNSYAAFKEWALANGYDPNAGYGECTIDRIDVNGNYEPSNCRWVSISVQNNNKRNGKSLN